MIAEVGMFACLYVCVSVCVVSEMVESISNTNINMLMKTHF